MKKKTFAVVVSLLALGAILNTAAFAVTERAWFDRPEEGVTMLVRDADHRA